MRSDVAGVKNPEGPAESVLLSIRRISRAVDLFSHELARKHSLTVPQLMCLRIIKAYSSISPSALAQEVALSQATVTGILKRLEARALLERRKCLTDRRMVECRITREGERMLAGAPLPLQQNLAQRLSQLSPKEQSNIAETLEGVVAMMEAAELDVAPILTSGPIVAEPGEVIEFLNETKPVDSDPIKKER